MTPVPVRTIIFIPAMMLLAASSCKVFRDVGSTALRGNETGGPGIMILQYTISKKDNGYHVRLTDRTDAKGKLKEKLFTVGEPEPGDLEYRVLDGYDRVISRSFIPDPLRRTYESPDAAGNLFRKEILLDSSAFFLRLQADPRAMTIIIDRYTGAGKDKIHLATNDLHQYQ